MACTRAASGSIGVAACSHPFAARGATEVYAAGGNAADAAVAVTFALFAALPHACGLGGDTMALVDRPDEARAINGGGRAPRGFTERDLTTHGGAVGVPGALAALSALHRAYGALRWNQDVAFAISLCEAGVPLSADLAAAAQRRRAALESRGTEWLALTSGCPAGGLLRQPRLAATLRRIAAEESGSLDAETAEAVVTACHSAGGVLANADLVAPTHETGAPVTARFIDAQLAFQPPPSQAILTAMTLRAVEALSVRDRPRRTQAFIEYVAEAFEHRNDIGLEDSAQWLLRVPLSLRAVAARHAGKARHGTHTAAVVTADATGLIVSVISSLFDDFGSAIYVPRGGFFLNDRLHGFERHAGSSNRPAAGRMPVQTLSPATVREPHRRWGIATPGADGQVQFLVQAIDAVLSDGKTIDNAIEQPRWRVVRDRVALEPHFDDALEEFLKSRGRRTYRRNADDGFFGGIVSAGISADGTLFAHADGRGECTAVSV
jgi:gamma-glutamyltranspeptidase/glutathione hydrolase